jgi:hypothetical protein
MQCSCRGGHARVLPTRAQGESCGQATSRLRKARGGHPTRPLLDGTALSVVLNLNHLSQWFYRRSERDGLDPQNATPSRASIGRRVAVVSVTL